MDSENARSSQAWDLVLDNALKIPGARVDRKAFLKRALFGRYSEEVVEKAIATRPSLAGIPPSDITALAKSSIAWHRTGVSTISLVTGLPGGWWIAGTVPADLAQFFWHTIVVLQKLAYLYGWPDFFENDSEEMDEQTRHIVTVFIGVMFGITSATKLLEELAKKLAGGMVERLPRITLRNISLFHVAKEVAIWLGGKMVKGAFARYLSRLVPIVSGLISGTITWISFSFMCRTLRLHLEALRFAERQT